MSKEKQLDAELNRTGLCGFWALMPQDREELLRLAALVSVKKAVEIWRMS